MKREEWYTSTLFRLLRLINNIIAELTFKSQHLQDLLILLMEKREGIYLSDKFHLVERQMRIVKLETDKLSRYFSDLERTLSPHSFDDHESPTATLGNRELGSNQVGDSDG